MFQCSRDRRHTVGAVSVVSLVPGPPQPLRMPLGRTQPQHPRFQGHQRRGLDEQTSQLSARYTVGNLRPEALRVNRYWQGAANDAYNRAVKPQSDAAAKVGTISERAST